MTALDQQLITVKLCVALGNAVRQRMVGGRVGVIGVCVSAITRTGRDTVPELDRVQTLLLPAAGGRFKTFCEH